VLKDGGLVTTLAHPLELAALPTPGRFFVDGFDVVFSFEGPKDRPAETLRIDLYGDEAIARRAP
jgi:hypothetical protein